MKPTYDEVIQVMTEAAMGAFHEADEAGRSPEECWKASQEAAIRAMQDMMPDAKGRSMDALYLYEHFKRMGG